MINQQKNQQNQQKSQQILAIMEAGIEYSTEQVAEKIGLKGPRTRQLLNELVDKELLACIGTTKRRRYIKPVDKKISIIIAKYEMYTRCWLVDNSVCAFANDYNNDDGGYIVAGVEEAHGIAVRPVKGIPEYMLEEDKNVMENLVVVI